MSSSFGKRHNLPGYDRFRTGLNYRDVWTMMRDENTDPKTWRHKSRGVVLGLWHELKLQLYAQMQNEQEGET